MTSIAIRRGLAVVSAGAIGAAIRNQFQDDGSPANYASRRVYEPFSESECLDSGIPELVLLPENTELSINSNIASIAEHVAADTSDLSGPARAAIRNLMGATLGHLSNADARRSIEEQPAYRALSTIPDEPLRLRLRPGSRPWSPAAASPLASPFESAAGVRVPGVARMPAGVDEQQLQPPPESRTYIAEANENPNMLADYRDRERFAGRVQVTITPLPPPAQIEEVDSPHVAIAAEDEEDDVEKAAEKSTSWTIAIAICAVLVLAAATRLGPVGALVNLLKTVARGIVGQRS
eukprot:TRINITY_DN20285_c0_g1_i1.p1 TRINITY_DN20285_c0_g1~~TRINITY_DN20285_c0_g1_i1.p1  ORF type:complete len:293 (-),score=67.23 TRINITY_DN20285_c0_g1_i1:391-1269(-)